MSQCPVCTAPVADDFGLVECSQCGAQLVVHMDGRVEHSGSQDGASAEEAPQFFEPMREFDLEEDPAEAPAEELSVPENKNESLGMPQPLPEESGEAFDLAPPGEDIVEDIVSEEPAPAGEPVEDPAQDMSFLDEEASVSAATPSPSTSAGLEDVAAFANSAASGGRDGSLRYNLQISGIDTADIRDAFREALIDKKFLWDVEAILKGIRNGEVRIENINPVKAHILISRLRLLPVSMSWEQYAISQ